MKEEIHRLNCYVENKPGAVSRMRIDVLGSARVVQQIILQLRNQVSVIEVTSRRL